MAKVFFGGQIKEESRGELAVLISHPKDKPLDYNIFMYPVFSDEFISLSGVRVPSNPVDRVYMGLSQKAGDEILINRDYLAKGMIDFDGLDKILIQPYFLKKALSLELHGKPN